MKVMKSASTSKPMAPIDPLQLLKALSPLLAADGGIKSVDEVGRLSSLMKKFSRKLVSRCVYVNVLQVSEPTTVEAFLCKGGWETIFQWLQEARECENFRFIVELLKLYKVLPMTVERLKENASAKVIKTLTKSNHEEIVTLATEIVDSWFKLVKGDPNASLSKTGDKEKSMVKKRPVKEEKRSNGMALKNSAEKKGLKRDKGSNPKVPSLVIKKDANTLKAVRTSKSKVVEKNNRHQNGPSINHRENNKKSLSSKEDLEDVKLPDYIRLTVEPKASSSAFATASMATTTTSIPQSHRGIKGERKKSTVKTYAAKTRSIGLEEPTPLPKLVIKKSSKDNKTLTLAPLKPTLKRPGLGVKEAGPSLPPNKKLKPPTLTLNVTQSKSSGELPAADKTTKPDSASPTSSPSAKSLDGASLAEQQLRREIKLIAARPKPAIHILTESAGFMDALVAGPAQPVRKKKKIIGASTSPVASTTSTTATSASGSGRVPTTPPSPAAPKLQFYKDTLDIQEESTATATATATGTATSKTDGDYNNDQVAEESRTDSTIVDESKCESTSRKADDEDNNFTTRDTPLSPDLKDDAGCLEILSRSLSAGPRKKTKKVSWAEESNLKQIHYFELDETERVNVNNVKNFGDMKTLDRLKEREAVELTRRKAETTDDRKPWLLLPIDLPLALVIAGSNSSERDIQRQREDSVLQEIFFSKDSIPDAPHEPDPEIVEPEETKIIPLIDENNPNAVVDYSMMELPPPVTSLPSALSNLVMSLSGKGTNDMASLGLFNAQQHVDIPGLGELPPPNHVGFPPPGGQMGPMGSMGYNMGPMDYYNNSMYPSNMGPNGPMCHPGPMRGGRGGFGPMRGANGNRRGNNNGPYQQRGNDLSGNQNQWNRGDRNNSNFQGGDRGKDRGNTGSRARTILCRHFVSGTCKYGDSCSFLHPGINGPAV